MNILKCIFVCLTLSALIANTSGLVCDPTEYSNNMREILNNQNDYDVVEGKFIFLETSSGSGANTDGVYGVFEFPDESVTTGEDRFTNYLLRAQDAYIFAGCTPPKSRYTSIASYVHQRFNDDSGDDFLYRSSLGAATNHLVWRTTDGPNAPFEAFSTVVQTADKTTWRETLTLLNENGIPTTQINLQSLPKKFIEFLPYEYDVGNIHEYTGPYDIGNIYNRITITYDQNELAEYMNLNQTVYRLRPKQATGNKPRKSFDVVRRETRNSQNLNVKAALSSKFEQYIDDIIYYFENDARFIFHDRSPLKDFYHEGVINNPPKKDYGITCLKRGMNCLDDVRDAIYWASPFKSFSPLVIKYFLLVGVLNSNEAINQSTYQNMGMYRNLKDLVPLGSFIDTDLTNSYANNIPTTISNEDKKKFFLIQASRFIVFPGIPRFAISKSELPDGVPFAFIGRDYLNPITKTRPDQSQLIRTQLLEFHAFIHL